MVVSLASWALNVRLNPDEYDKALTMLVPTMGLALTSVYASGLLVAALLERRPALRDRQGRRLWAWTAMFTVVFAALGFANSSSRTFGQVLLYGSGLCVTLICSVGLVVSTLPHWRRRETGR